MGKRTAGLEPVALPIRSNAPARAGWLVAAVAAVASAGCGSHHAGGTAAVTAERSAFAWPQAKAVEHARRARLAVGGRRPTIDPASVVCWGVGPADVHAGTRRWTRFRCIAPTFRGAAAGPDVLFVLRPTGARTFSIEDERLSSY